MVRKDPARKRSFGADDRGRDPEARTAARPKLLHRHLRVAHSIHFARETNTARSAFHPSFQSKWSAQSDRHLPTGPDSDLLEDRFQVVLHRVRGNREFATGRLRVAPGDY